MTASLDNDGKGGKGGASPSGRAATPTGPSRSVSGIADIPDAGDCGNCGGEEWVCENHQDRPWSPTGCECGAGAPCPVCRPVMACAGLTEPLRTALKAIIARAPTEKPDGPYDTVWGGYSSDNFGDVISDAQEAEAWECAEIARAALAQGTEARSDETEGLGPQGDGPVGNADAPDPLGEGEEYGVTGEWWGNDAPNPSPEGKAP